LADQAVPLPLPATSEEALRAICSIQFIPDANLLVTVPLTDDKLILHRIDVDALLTKSGFDYYYVGSRPTEAVQRGKEYRHQIHAKSNKGGLKYKLEGPPKGMTVNAEGLVTWQTDAQQALREEPVLMTISDAAGKELFHNLKWTPKTGQSNKLLMAVQERGKHGAKTEVAHGGV
jgi:hypothetical protein